ncbi:MAG TPA: hypothetical protein VF715_08135 [Thermoleophilaceae bacterium]
MAGPALTPELALDYLAELSTDIRAGVLLDGDGSLAASWGGDDSRGERVRELVVELMERADAAAGERDRPSQVEVSTGAGGVFCVREGSWTIAVVTGRYALASLMFLDLRKLLEDLERSAA